MTIKIGDIIRNGWNSCYFVVTGTGKYTKGIMLYTHADNKLGITNHETKSIKAEISAYIIVGHTEKVKKVDGVVLVDTDIKDVLLEYANNETAEMKAEFEATTHRAWEDIYGKKGEGVV